MTVQLQIYIKHFQETLYVKNLFYYWENKDKSDFIGTVLISNTFPKSVRNQMVWSNNNKGGLWLQDVKKKKIVLKNFKYRKNFEMTKNSSLHKSKKVLKASNAIVWRCPCQKQKKKI